VNWLPETLPAKPKVLWEASFFSKGLGGVAATKDYVLVSDRELEDAFDAFKCFDAATGKELWAHRYRAMGNLDYGNSSRATPLIHGEVVIFFGALGHLSCCELATGKPLWEMNIREKFGADDERKWGMCSSPLIVDGKLIVNPGGKDASLVALEPKTGKVLWKSPGKPASHGSFIAGRFGGKLQIVGYDSDSLGGWDPADGKRLWTVKPPKQDFNVPTPIQVVDKLLVSTENSGTRLYRFKDNGAIDEKPVAANADLKPDTHTPVVVGDRVFGVWNRLFCLSLKNDLKEIWTNEDNVYLQYASLIATNDRVLVTTIEGELLLIDASSKDGKPISRVKLLKDEQGVYSHPALVGTRLYLRGNSSLVCVELKP
jgi:outer membrane protein assembly factor BamB